MKTSTRGRRRLTAILAALLVGASVAAAAHQVSENNAAYIEAIQGIALAPFAYLGAKHMVTGYDHLLFLVGVVFFLRRLKDVILYVSLFTLGHSLTLLTGVWYAWRVDAYLVDAVIGASVVYKAFENMGGLRAFNVGVDARAAVLVFGLFHGLGLATKLQELALSEDGLMANLVSFNVGVELGQVIALAAIVAALSVWRMRPSFERTAFAANALLLTAGFILIGQQLTGYWLSA